MTRFGVLRALAWVLACTAAGAARATPVDASISGVWSLEGRPDEVLILEQRLARDRAPGTLTPGLVLVSWLTLDEHGHRRVVRGEGVAEADVVRAERAWTPRGDPDGRDEPGRVKREPWGSLTLTRTSCDTAVLEIDGREGLASARITVERRHPHLGLPCGSVPAEARADRPFAGSFDGHYRSIWTQDEVVAWSLTEKPVQGLLFWMTFDAEGRSTWRTGVSGPSDVTNLVFEDVRGEGPFGRTMFMPNGCREAWFAWVEAGTDELQGVILERDQAVLGTRCAEGLEPEE